MSHNAFPQTTPVADELVLHVGARKTGTSSLQIFLATNRDGLAGRGVLYPSSPGKVRHDRIGMAMLPEEQAKTKVMWARMKVADHAVFRRRTRRRLLEECATAGLPRVLLSDELLFGLPPRSLRLLGKWSRAVAMRVRVVVYLRRQDRHLPSNYQQAVKVGETRRLCDWARLDHSADYDYAERLRLWRRHVAPEGLVVRRFEPHRFIGGSLHTDFLDASGLGAADEGWDSPADRNQSLPAEAVEFLRLWNLYRVEHTGATVGLIDNRLLHAPLAGLGPTLDLAPEEAGRFQDLWTEGNRWVASEFFGERGDLFGDGGSSREVTTIQRLSPERLPHYLELLEVDPAVHAPLMRICEREAG